VTTLAVEAPPVTGWFEGIANRTDVKDRQLDTTLPGSFVRTAADLNSGRVAWAVTRQHSSDPAEVLGWVTAAKETPEGLWIRGTWAPDPVAQQLRAAVAAGAPLSLPITYIARGTQPDGAGGRLLSDVDVTSIAITNDPANGGSFIIGGKGTAAPGPETAPIVGLYDSIQAEAERNHPDRERIAREDAMLAAASWPPPGMFDRKTALSLLEGAAWARSRREAEGDPERAREQAQRDFANRYSNGLAAWMAANRPRR
jgi:HK97 family phage prohead protease